MYPPLGVPLPSLLPLCFGVSAYWGFAVEKKLRAMHLCILIYPQHGAGGSIACVHELNRHCCQKSPTECAWGARIPQMEQPEGHTSQRTPVSVQGK